MDAQTLQLDSARIDAFAERMVRAINDAGLMLMTSLGHRTGLFDVMARLNWAGSHAIAAEAAMSERYVREWLGAMVTAGVVEHAPADKTYRLPAEHAACLTRAAAPNNIAVTAQWFAILGSVEDQVAEAFRHGRGVPYSAYKGFHRVMAEESAQTTVAGLEPHILPLVSGLIERLERGMNVVDVGCGAGQAMIHLAGRFPRSRFLGIDFSHEAINRARQEAESRRLGNLSFRATDLAEWCEPAAYDLVTAFDAIHDQAQPARVLAHIRRSLTPDGVFLMQDIKASSHVHQNCGRPLGTFTYAISTMHCMSVSLAHGGPGLGAAWGVELAREMLAEAGFAEVTVSELPHDPINFYYVAR